MSIAITEDHKALAGTASDFLRKGDARGAARALLEAPEEVLPAFWSNLANLGWLGLHIPEQYGGAGFGLEELVVVVEELGRALAPGPFIPTVIASAVIAAVGDEDLKRRVLPALVDGSRTAAVAIDGGVEVRGGKACGSVGVVLGASFADVVVIAVGDDLVVLEGLEGVEIEIPANLDPTRRSGRLVLTDVPVIVVRSGRRALKDLTRLVLAAESVGIARECAVQGAEYAKVREQFGRPIATFQAVKHHCANMFVAAELATAAVWDAARAAPLGGDQRAIAAAIAATLAAPAAYLCANLNIQVHGGIGMTWEHDAHLYLRRATVLMGLTDPDDSAAELIELTRAGIRRSHDLDLPPEAEPIRDEVRGFAVSIKEKDAESQRDALIESGYVQPHWPRPWGREAGALEQLVIEQEFGVAGVKSPRYGITAWVILTLIQHATDEQVQRWVPSALSQEIVWCQLFSEPGAGSDAAGIRMKGTRAKGGWVINGQKVWTSGAQIAGRGMITVRTDPQAPKHRGITIMVVDMKAAGVEIRPLRQTTGQAEFNEVFFNDVFVPDDDVVGAVNDGWTVARATLGNESVSIGGDGGGLSLPADVLLALYVAHPQRLPGGAVRIGHYAATHQAAGLLNIRSAARAVAGGGPSPEGAVTKLVLSELGHDAAGIMAQLCGPEIAFTTGDSERAVYTILMNRSMSIAGGTSEIKRNQIGERILGLPRDPLLSN